MSAKVPSKQNQSKKRGGQEDVSELPARGAAVTGWQERHRGQVLRPTGCLAEGLAGLAGLRLPTQQGLTS